MSDKDWWFVDLAAVVAITGGLAFGLLSGVEGVGRIALSIPLVLFLPGYALVAVLFPDEADSEYRPFDDEKTGLRNPLLVDGGLDAVERFILSIVLSVALVPAIALFTTVTPGGIALRSVLVGIALTTIVLTLVAIVARYGCPPERRFSIALSPPFFFRDVSSPYESTSTRRYNVAIAVSLLLLLASVGFAIANPPPHDGFTEFNVETANVTGETETMYDDSYTVGNAQNLTVSITNQEHRETTYTTVVVLQRVSYDDGVTVHEEDHLATEPVTVADGATREQTLEVTPTMAGDDLRLVVLLYEGEPPAEPSEENAYRALHLPIEVA
ncbi:DUF1616 domain-containing protein [Natribaculum luteum]|uniref:DUF1616 domain-containing protein n=1 Tax=Natribaculum luteum TaxID=1586232 RepID=A0ABD5NY79_9EURY|nr:DUF1616 domain-containing protein [Natribaculum luteum]